MQQLLIISGKGGTGKTSLTASLAALADHHVLTDCDVDAADLHLVLQPKIKERYDFYGGKVAEIDPVKCTQCHQCADRCRFQAIEVRLDSLFWDTTVNINPLLCEGCTLCRYVCPMEAIQIKNNLCGEWYVSETRFGPLVHAKLGIGEENSGKLVTKVLSKAREIGESQGMKLLIIDGPPGVGCPVISSFSGTDLALIVTEPSMSGLHDLDRALKLAEHFGVKSVVCINKADLHLEMTQKIVQYCKEIDVEVIGQIPFDKQISEAICNGMSPWEYLKSNGDMGITKILQNIYDKLMTLLDEED